MQTFDEILNRGRLPFVGRQIEIERIVAFWRSTVEASGLRAQLIVGEAGIGKSRLVDEAIPRVIEAGGTVVHARLYPGSTTSAIPAIAQALRRPDAGRSLLAAEPEDSLGSVAASLRRLSRLRATLLVLEDIHLLEPETLAEFSELMSTTNEETLSLVCTSRPAAGSAWDALERYVVERIDLCGLRPRDIAELWHAMTDAAPPADLTHALHDATVGNPLAVRSALRGAVSSGALRHDLSGGWEVTTGGESLVQWFRTSVSKVADAMTAHLSDDERAAAEQLAMLGEVFSVEAAHAMLGSQSAHIESLRAHGMISQTSTPVMPLAVRSSAYGSLSFTHTLVHHRMLQGRQRNTSALLQVIAIDAPLHSLQPFELIASSADIASSPELLEDALNTTLDIAHWIDATPDWSKKETLFAAAEALLSASEDDADQERLERMRLELLRAKLEMSHRGDYESRRPMIDELLLRTENPSQVTTAAARVSAFAVQLFHRPDTREPALAEVQRLLEAFPSLRTHAAHGTFLYNVGSSLLFSGDVSGSELVRFRESVEAALQLEDVSPVVREQMQLAWTFTIFAPFTSSRDMHALLERTLEFENLSPALRARVILIRASRMMNAGWLTRARRDAERTHGYYGDIGFQRFTRAADVIAIAERTVFGEEFDSIERAAEALIREVPVGEASFWRFHVGLGMISFPLLLGDRALAQRMSRTYPEGVLRIPAPLRSHFGFPEINTARPPLYDVAVDEDCATIAAFVRDPKIGIGGIKDALTGLFERELIEIYDLVVLHAALDAVDAAMASGMQKSVVAPVIESCGDAVGRALTWLAEPERELYPLMSALVERVESLIPAKECAEWRRRIEALRRRREEREAPTEERTVRVSMIGSVVVTQPGSEPHRMQGGRVRRALGVMVANSLLDVPLTLEEFARVVAGPEPVALDEARATVKKTVHRLRETMGSDSILTAGSTPRLDPTRVGVDLTDAHALLKRSREALRRSQPLLARHALLASMHITRGDVLFPSLYDSFFEAAREQFEADQRAQTLNVANALMGEGANEDAAEILRSAVDALPGDDEISDMLGQVLLRLGRHVEVERLRMKQEAI